MKLSRRARQLLDCRRGRTAVWGRIGGGEGMKEIIGCYFILHMNNTTIIKVQLLCLKNTIELPFYDE